ncbi:MAG TPA: uroporphyrinogen-III synthase [Polaromonas sp.]|jgi:uroporphyrinogen-III synthase|nr:uroporphyrinogen-III synthase [Polaromonas sp.]HQS89738.1 uroporphyrinogen-III synthase [Polaromonas sp.]
MGGVRVIVTRPERESRQWVEQLQRAGFAAEALPLIEIGPAASPADVQALQQAWQSLATYAACLFVSGNAVHYFFKQNRSAAQVIPAQAAIKTIATMATEAPPVLPAGLRFMAPGPGTAAALRAAGVPATQIDGPAADAQQFDSQALWQAAGGRDWRGSRVLIVRGQSLAGPHGEATDSAAAPGRDWIARQWTSAGATVDFLRVYLRRAPQPGPAQRQLALSAGRDGSVWLLSSSEAVHNLASFGAIDLRRARALATHPRIAEAARAAGWGLVVESRPQLEDITQALDEMIGSAAGGTAGSIELGHP